MSDVRSDVYLFQLCPRNVENLPEILTHYDRQNDLIPPQPRTCFLSLDLWVNAAFRTALADGDKPIGVDTKMDIMLHSAMIKIGDSDTFN